MPDIPPVSSLLEGVARARQEKIENKRSILAQGLRTSPHKKANFEINVYYY